MRSPAEKAAKGAVFTALALILSYVESLIPFSFAIPGIKPGFANLAVMILLYISSPWEAFAVNILRILLQGFLFGNLFGILYSLAGGIFSFLIMIAVKRTGQFTVTGVSIAGGAAHNIAQLIVASLIVSDPKILSFMPVLTAAGATSGLLTGIIASVVVRRLKSVSAVDLQK
ncbi:MAG: Gx transporter family protein [Lachnospiraceae bacterium]|nr:Gx transporter family protein [Lachnospiraceae bacterium]